MPGVNAPKAAGAPSVSDKVAGTVPPALPGTPTSWVTSAEALGSNAPSPRYLALIWCEPPDSADVVSFATPSVKAVYQSHKNLRPDGEKVNTAPEFIANMEKECAGNVIQMAVAPDGGSYTLSIPATKHERTYQTRKHP